MSAVNKIENLNIAAAAFLAILSLPSVSFAEEANFQAGLDQCNRMNTEISNEIAGLKATNEKLMASIDEQRSLLAKQSTADGCPIPQELAKLRQENVRLKIVLRKLMD